MRCSSFEGVTGHLALRASGAGATGPARHGSGVRGGTPGDARERAAPRGEREGAFDLRLGIKEPLIVVTRGTGSVKDTGHALDGIEAANRQFLGAALALWSAVAEARAAEVSWRDIGRALGVSPQAAQQRFSKPPPGRLF